MSKTVETKCAWENIFDVNEIKSLNAGIFFGGKTQKSLFYFTTDPCVRALPLFIFCFRNHFNYFRIMDKLEYLNDKTSCRSELQEFGQLYLNGVF